MYPGINNAPKLANIGMLPAPAYGSPGRKRIRESLLPPNDMLPNHFPPPPIPHPPAVRLGFNAYEQQQVTQKRVRLNNDNNTPAMYPVYSYGNVMPSPDTYQQDYYRQQNNLAPQESYNQLQPQNYFAYNQPNSAHYSLPQMPVHSLVPQYNVIPPGNPCSSSYPHNSMHSFGYKQIKENSDPNIPTRPTTPLPLQNTTQPNNGNSSDSLPQTETREGRYHQLSRGLQLITVSPEGISRWVPLLESFNIIFEIYANCTSLPTPFSLSGETSQSPAKMFYLGNPHSKQPTDQLKCVFWELDTPLLPIQLDRVYRIIGSFDVRNSYLKVFDVRAARMDEITNWPALVARSNRLIKKMPFSHNEV